MTIQFAWNGNLKPVSTSFIGTSPAFELALYSLVFLLDSKTEEHTVRVGVSFLSWFRFFLGGMRFFLVGVSLCCASDPD